MKTPFAAVIFFVPVILVHAGNVATIPEAYGAIPSQRQLRWHEMEFYGMIHFGLNTFTDKEWGYGDVSPELFNPSALDPDKVAKEFQDAGMKGLKGKSHRRCLQDR
jgi:alpha-L-fucosidase